MAELAKEQLADSIRQEIRKDMDTTDRTRFYENGDGILCRHGQQEGTQQVVVPRSLVADVLEREHSSPLGGHPGETKMHRTLRRRYYWPSLAADVFGWVAACATCAKNRLMGVRSSSAMRLFPATEPFEAVAIDLLGPLFRTPEGYEYLLVTCDRFSKLTRVAPLRDVTALDVLSAFTDVWIASYGIPDSTLSDNGLQFASVLYQGVLQMLGVSTNYATPYHPQTNGQVERFNKTLVQQPRHYVSEHVVTWARYVSLLVTVYNSQVHISTGEAPFSFVCPRKLNPVAIERLTQGTCDDAPPSTPRQARENFRKRLEEMIPLFQISMDKAQAR